MSRPNFIKGSLIAATCLGTGCASDPNPPVFVPGPSSSIEESVYSTGVFVNGRELPPQGVMELQLQLGPIRPGRYWLDAFGNYGYEGRPALGNLNQVGQARRNSGIPYNQRAAGGNVGSDGRQWYYLDRESGSSVMSSN
jgi:hypothetical protein